MKKILSVLWLLSLSIFLASCEITEVLEENFNEDNTLEETFDTSSIPNMIETLSSRRRDNRMSTSELSDMIQSGEYLESEKDFYLYCDVLRSTLVNEDGTYTETYTYYDYDYDIYQKAYESIYNGVDDDNDGIIDEDDEVILFVTEEMTDGIDNNHNGVIDEYYEMTPTYVVTYIITYNEGTPEIVTSLDGTVTTTYEYFYSYKEIRSPYTGQKIAYGPCYSYNYETGEYLDEETSDTDIDPNLDLYEAYENLVIEIQQAIALLSEKDQSLLRIVYTEFQLGRKLSDNEKDAIDLVLELYKNLNFELVSNEVFETEIEYIEFYLNRPLTEIELEAFNTFSMIQSSLNNNISLEQLISFYASILERPLTDLEKEALGLYESYSE